MSDHSLTFSFLVCSLATWRVTHLLTAEDGPGDIVFLLRRQLGNSMAGKALDCFYCLSMWTSMPFAFVLSTGWPQVVLYWLSLSGAACLLEQLIAVGNHLHKNSNR